jgi:NADH-quinone oxidoreductase subunit G
MMVSIMPCTAKKGEILRPEHFTDGEQDVDYVLTTSEVSRMIKEAGIDLSKIEAETMDMPFGLSSGAAAIFGVSGGVTEAVIRHVVGSSKPEILEKISHIGVRGDEGLKEITLPFGDRELKIAIVSGLKNADDLLKKIKAGEVYYDFVEVMACKRGCIAGGGQPLPMGDNTKKARMDGLYKVDSVAQIKLSNENPIVKYLYEGFLKGKEHKLLHTR